MTAYNNEEILVCVLERKRERERERDKESDRDRDRKIKFVLAKERKQQADGGKCITMSFVLRLSSPPSTIC